MAATARPRRSVLYMPGSNARALEKAKTIMADGLILDLEDAVAPDAKDQARLQVCNAVKDGGYGMREITIRVNGLSTPWGYEDIAAASRSGAHAIVLPKVESADAIRHMEAIMVANGAPDDMAIWAMMETPTERALGRAHRRGEPAHGLSGHGNIGSGQGAGLHPHPRTPADDHVAGDLHAGGARRRSRHP